MKARPLLSPTLDAEPHRPPSDRPGRSGALRRVGSIPSRLALQAISKPLPSPDIASPWLMSRLDEVFIVDPDWDGLDDEVPMLLGVSGFAAWQDDPDW